MTLATALSIAIPVVAAVLGIVADTSARPSTALQLSAEVGHGYGALGFTAFPESEGDIAEELAEAQRVARLPVHEVVASFQLPITVRGAATTLLAERRNWSDPLFADVVLLRTGDMPFRADEVALSPVAADRLHLAIGDHLVIAGKRFRVTGLAARPQALSSQVLYLPIASTVDLFWGPNATVSSRFVIGHPLDTTALGALPANMVYLTPDLLATRTSIINRLPVAYGALLLVAFLGAVMAIWSLFARRRAPSITVVSHLGGPRAMRVATSAVQALLSVLVGLAVAAVAIAAAAPFVHGSVAARADQIAEPDWFPTRAAIAVAGVGALMMVLSAVIGQGAGLRAGDRRRRLPTGSAGLSRSVRRAARARGRSIFIMVGVAAAVMCATLVQWQTSNKADETGTATYQRPGDIQVQLPKGIDLGQFQEKLAAVVPPPFSIVSTVVVPGVVTSGMELDAGIGLPNGDFVQNIQVLDTDTDWLRLTGHEPTDAERVAINSGQLVGFDPQLSSETRVTILAPLDSGPRPLVVGVPATYFPEDQTTHFRTSAAISRAAAKRLGLVVSRPTGIVAHTETSKIDDTALQVGRVAAGYGITGFDIKVGRPVVVSPPLIIVVLTWGMAVLVVEAALFAAIAAGLDEFRARKVLFHLGASIPLRCEFQVAVTTPAVAGGVAIGGTFGIAAGAIVAVAFGAGSALTISVVPLVGLFLASLLVAGATSVLIAVRPASSRTH